ncbi:MAG TPA: TonB family protein [Myxococcaceae bacterium]|nr:TonB family protein [Myxococcaceae bacterium]
MPPGDTGTEHGDRPACATPPCSEGPGVLSEDVVARMPVLLSGPDVTLSPEARRSGVEGPVRVRCVITAAGTVEGCEVLERLPLAEAAVLAALQARHYRPAEVGGRAVPVHHLFTIRIHPGR